MNIRSGIVVAVLAFCGTVAADETYKLDRQEWRAIDGVYREKHDLDAIEAEAKEIQAQIGKLNERLAQLRPMLEALPARGERLNADAAVIFSGVRGRLGLPATAKITYNHAAETLTVADVRTTSTP